MSCYISLHGFNPGSEKDFQCQLETRFEDLLDHAPSDASIVTELVRGHDGFTGNIIVSSPVGRFSAQGRSTTAHSLSESLISDVENQIMDWKHRRFNDEDPEDSIRGEIGWLGHGAA